MKGYSNVFIIYTLYIYISVINWSKQFGTLDDLHLCRENIRRHRVAGWLHIRLLSAHKQRVGACRQNVWVRDHVPQAECVQRDRERDACVRVGLERHTREVHQLHAWYVYQARVGGRGPDNVHLNHLVACKQWRFSSSTVYSYCTIIIQVLCTVHCTVYNRAYRVLWVHVNS